MNTLLDLRDCPDLLDRRACLALLDHGDRLVQLEERYLVVMIRSASIRYRVLLEREGLWDHKDLKEREEISVYR